MQVRLAARLLIARFLVAKVLVAVLLPVVATGCADRNNADQNQMKLKNQIHQLRQQLNETGLPRNVIQGDLIVQLVFGSEADLDLYVTDPLLETVYFANGRTKSGGEITKDVRCDAGDLRIEEVIFKAPLPGRYRVGVDYPESCGSKDGSAAYIVTTSFEGNREEVSGSVQLQQFKVVAMEFDIEAASIE